MTDVAAPAKKADDRRKDNVQVGTNRSKAVYADVTKHLLAGGETTVELSALGNAITEAVGVAEMLKNQGIVVIKKIETSRGVADARRQNTDKISIFVGKAKEFDKLYAEQQKTREERKAAKGEAKAEPKA
jgi:DNA-binding protein